MTGDHFESLTERFLRETQHALNRDLQSGQDPYQAYIDLVDELVQQELKLVRPLPSERTDIKRRDRRGPIDAVVDYIPR